MNHQAYLVQCVMDTWRLDPLEDRARLAASAVHEVLTALRANPAWCRSLRIGPEQ